MTTSGRAERSQSSSWTIRVLTELTFQVARRIGSGGKGIAAAAGSSGVGIAHLERSADQVLDIVDLGALEQVERYRVDQHGHPVAAEGQIILLPRVVEGEVVL